MMRVMTAALLALVTAACGRAGAEGNGQHSAFAGDSILEMSVMIERFQAAHAPVESFGADAPRSRDELIERFRRAVKDSSAAQLRALTMTEAEFAYLYFPASLYARPPYAQPPGVSWLLTEQNGLKGETRLLRHLGGRPLDIAGHTCEDPPRTEGANTIWNDCRLTLRHEDGSEEAGVRLFGSVIERGGRFRFISLANRL
jgi:hypothetical protein